MKFLFRLDRPFFWPAAGLNPEPRTFEPRTHIPEPLKLWPPETPNPKSAIPNPKSPFPIPNSLLPVDDQSGMNLSLIFLERTSYEQPGDRCRPLQKYMGLFYIGTTDHRSTFNPGRNIDHRNSDSAKSGAGRLFSGFRGLSIPAVFHLRSF